MRLISIKLENIRSYLNQEIGFPEGSVLLSGDIGSGKSSILLAAEFALFGIRRKHLPGNSLLRNGKNTGSVELKFNLEGREIIIKRTLKRGKNEVQQDSGYIVINGIKKAGTPVELKAIVLDLLGYPKELVSKTKNLVYRYTVFTPQEEMKQILVEDDAELRLDTLRKVFGIDKYKRIRENCQILLRQIKENKKELLIKTEDLEQTEKEKAEKIENIKILDQNIGEIAPKIRSIEREIETKKEDILAIEVTIKEQYALKQDLSLLDIELRNKIDQRTRNSSDLVEVEKQIISLKKELEGKADLDVETVQRRIGEINRIIKEKESGLNDVKHFISENKVKKIQSIDIKSKILHLAKCPTCEQTVSKEYKESILERENRNIDAFDSNLFRLQEEKNALEKKIKSLSDEHDSLRKQESSMQINKIKADNLKEKERSKSRILLMQEELKKNIGYINIKKIELNKKIKIDAGLENKYSASKKQLEKFQEEKHKAEIAKNSFEKEKQIIAKDILILQEKIKKKTEARKKLKGLIETQSWLDNHFVPLMAFIEKQVMLNIHKEFDELFKQWFNMIMEDENLNVRIDEQFIPVAEQNGYDIDISHLSGGERTSAALAYRLALNKVVNDVIGTIRTKDMIILDEPTDGFSSEQLDRVREVLEQIGVKQTIIVSHENKIESFVDHVIRINKNEHVSEVI
jgi:exonuclease SbcC